MTFKSIIRRLMQGPTIRILIIYKITKDIFKEKSYKSAEIECVRITRAELNKISYIQNLNAEKAFEKMYLKEICIIGNYHNIPCGHASMGLFPDFYLLKNKIEKNAAYIHYCYVNEAYRGKQVYPNMLRYLLYCGFVDKRLQAIYICTEQRNIASQKGILKTDFLEWKKCYEIGWGNMIFFRFYKKI